MSTQNIESKENLQATTAIWDLEEKKELVFKSAKGLDILSELPNALEVPVEKNVCFVDRDKKKAGRIIDEKEQSADFDHMKKTSDTRKTQGRPIDCKESKEEGMEI